MVLGIGDYSDDFKIGVKRLVRRVLLEAAELNGLTNGIFVPEVGAGEGLVDNGHMSSRLHVVSRKKPAAQQVSTQSLEIALTTHVKRGAPRLGMSLSGQGHLGPPE